MPETSQPEQHDESRFNSLGSMPTIWAVAFLAMMGGLIAAFAFYRLAPLKDPVDVVGVPLLTGYSETNEQWSFYTFVLTTLLLAFGLRNAAARAPVEVLPSMGALSALVLLSLPAWSNSPGNLPAVTLAGVFTFVAGVRWIRLAPGSPVLANLTAMIGLALWSIGFPELPVILTRHWTFLLAVVIAVVTLRWLDARLFTVSRRDLASSLSLAAAILVLGGTWTANPREFLLGLAGAAGFVLGSRAGLYDGVMRAFSRFHWWAYVGILSGVLYLGTGWPSFGLIQPLAALTGGAGGAAVLCTAIRSRDLSRFCTVMVTRSLEQWAPWWGVTAIALVAWAKPWWGLVSTVIAAVVVRANPRGRVGVGLAFAVAMLLPMGILPASSRGGIDGFHDGQILSAVWEFETGRPLYSEVFPLRSFEFFTAWISRSILGQTIESYFLGMGLLAALPIGGACLLTFAWTRSLVWSFATAMMIATGPELIGRMGVPLWLAAVGVLVLRSHHAHGMAWLVVCGWVSALLGYDVLVSFVGASVAAVFFAGPPGLRQPLKRSMRAGIGWAAALLAAMVVPFTLFLVIWQGPRAALAYWWLLIDNVRTYAAFAGLPLCWDDPWLRFLPITALVVVGLWAAMGAALWKQMSQSRRRAWVFLLVHFVLMAHRGLARSDYDHLNVVIYPSIVFASIGSFECLRTFRREGVRSVFTNHRAVALVSAAVACWVSPNGQSTPWDFASYVRQTLSSVDPDEHRSEAVLEHVGEDEYLWEMEDAMMNYIHKRHNPTRHALAYCISSPEEQRAAVASLREHPPKLVAWRFMSGSNGIANPLRFYVISQFLYRNYQPAANGWFLQPKGPEPLDTLPLATRFLGRLDLGQLALRWGKERIPRLGARLEDRRGLTVEATQMSQLAVWKIEAGFSPREFNYLKLDFACSRDGVPNERGTKAVVEITPIIDGEDDDFYESNSAVSFVAIADGVTRPYLIPVGCSPGWSWRATVQKLALVAPDDFLIAHPQVECWKIDDIRD